MRKPVNMRLPESLLSEVDAYADDNGITRTSAVENLVRMGLEAAEDATEGTQHKPASDVPHHDYKAVLEVLRESNSDLRRHASQLYAQLDAKDKQIASLQTIVNQSQQLEMGRLAAATSEGTGRSLRSRIRRLFGMDGGEAHE